MTFSRPKIISWEEISLLQIPKRASSSERKILKENISRCRFYRFIYKSSSGAVAVGYLVEPRIVKKKLPCIIYNRGGYGDFGKISPYLLAAEMAMMARWGYIVIGSQYRGSDGGTGKDEFGGCDIDDVLILKDILAYYSKADAKRIGMFGFSRGGLMTYLALGKVRWIAAAAAIGAPADLFRNESLRPEMGKIYQKAFGRTKEGKRRRSAILWADNFSKNSPVLIIHALNDDRVSPLDSVELSERLSAAGIQHRLALFKKGGHFLNRSGVWLLIKRWFNRYLK